MQISRADFFDLLVDIIHIRNILVGLRQEGGWWHRAYISHYFETTANSNLGPDGR